MYPPRQQSNTMMRMTPSPQQQPGRGGTMGRSGGGIFGGLKAAMGFGGGQKPQGYGNQKPMMGQQQQGSSMGMQPSMGQLPQMNRGGIGPSQPPSPMMQPPSMQQQPPSMPEPQQGGIGPSPDIMQQFQRAGVQGGSIGGPMWGPEGQWRGR
jgi:hypothetical protein